MARCQDSEFTFTFAPLSNRSPRPNSSRSFTSFLVRCLISEVRLMMDLEEGGHSGRSFAISRGWGEPMLDFFSKLFDTSGFPPRWHCGVWTAGHGWLHIVSDLAVWSAYFTIPCILAYFVLRRRDVPFSNIFWLFGAFILACGTTHLMEAIIFWHPLYRLAGVIKLVTAIVSWGTVVALVPIVPKALAMHSPGRVGARDRSSKASRGCSAASER